MKSIIFLFISFIFALSAWPKYNSFQCSNLKTYKKYLETAPLGTLERHPKCNAFAIRAAKKSSTNRDMWINEIEPTYRAYFGHPSAVFKDCPGCVSKAPIFPYKAFKKIKRDYVLVLSVDGGGVRGLIPAKILEHIEKKTGTPITDIFDIYVGTSTGGLISLFLTTPDEFGRPQYNTSQLVQMYKTLSSQIFKKALFSFRRLRSKFGLTSTYSAKTYERLLKKYFSNNMMRQAVKPVLVTSIDLKKKEPVYLSSIKLFNTLPYDAFVWEAARATSAAPVYFKPLKLKLRNGQTYVLGDGGVGINNPSFLGLLMAKRMFPKKKILLVSLSTGTKPKSAAIKYSGPFGGGAFSLKKGTLNLTGIIDNLASVPGVTSHQAVQMIVNHEGGVYFRIASNSNEDIRMDDASHRALKKLEKIAEEMIEKNKDLRRLLVLLPSFIQRRKALNNQRFDFDKTRKIFERHSAPTR